MPENKQPENKEEKKVETLASTEAPKEPEKSVVDTVFDVVTDWTVTGLRGTQRGLEVGARWLDARAKAVGELAQKLAQHDEPEQKQAA